MRDFVFPMFRANAIYEGEYLLGTSIARPLIAKRQIEIARLTGADAVSHGATGKGNDQVRFELGYYALEPNIRVIAPWREWDLVSREKLLKYAEKHGIPVEGKKKAGSPYSTDANLLHISYEGRILENPAEGTGSRHVALDRVARSRRRTAPSTSNWNTSRATSSPSTARSCRRRKSSRHLTSSAASTASDASTWWRTATSA